MQEHKTNQDLQNPQKILAKHVTELVHGEEESINSAIKSRVLFEKDDTISEDDICAAFKTDPIFSQLKNDEFIGKRLVDVFVNVQSKLSKSIFNFYY